MGKRKDVNNATSVVDQYRKQLGELIILIAIPCDIRIPIHMCTMIRV